MSLPALLQFIFAPVLGLLFAPVLSALVRVRVGAVLSALIVAASLSAGAPAEAQRANWNAECKTDEWDDSTSCTAYVWVLEGRNPFLMSVPALTYHCNSAGEQKLSIIPDGPMFGFERVDGKWESGESFTLHKVQIRWDKEPASEGILLQEDGGSGYQDYQLWWRNRAPDWWGWGELKMTPTTFPNPIRLLQEKSLLRIRAKSGESDDASPEVETYPLAGARKRIAEAKRGCGL